MKNLLLALLFVPSIIYAQDPQIKDQIKNIKFEGKPKKIIITFPDSIDVYKVMSRQLLKFNAPITNSDRDLGMINTDYFSGPHTDKTRQNCLVFIDGHKAIVTGRYSVKEIFNNILLEGEAQAKGMGTSVYRNAFYNLIYVFYEYKEYMTFE